MQTNGSLINVFEGMSDTNKVGCITFDDGDSYDLSIVSTMHAEEGGDIAAEVVRVIRSARPDYPAVNTFLNFYLSEVCRVEVDGQCLFSKTNA